MTTTQNGSGITRQTYSRLVYAIGGIGIIGLLAGMVLGHHLAGTVVYLLGVWIGGGIALVAPLWSDTKLQDERDYDLHNRASGLTIGITMVAGLSIVPVIYVLDAGGYVGLAGAVGGAIAVFSGLFLLYGICFGVVKRRN